MTRRPTIDQLCDKYRNEGVHTEFVTELALQIFDALREELGLSRRDRRVLEAAARLHDVAYSLDPPGHPAAGANLLIRNGLAGFGPSETKCIAVIILLHGKEYAHLLHHPIFDRLKNKQRALRLASILRVADGLDHGHIQNTRIIKIRRRRRDQPIRITVRTGGSVDNLASAEKKADLWRKTYPIGIEFRKAKRSAATHRIAGATTVTDTVLEAARKLLASQYRAIADQREGALLGQDPEYLHAMRVGIRRYRAILKVFRSQMESSSRSRLNQGLSVLAAKLSPIRDIDVWVEFISRKDIDESMTGLPGWQDYVDAQREIQEKQFHILRRILKSQMYENVMQQTALFTRIEIPTLARTNRPHPCRAFAARRLRRTFRRITDQVRLHRSTSPEVMHELRRLCRRERYWAEFFAPVLGGFVDDLVKRLKAIVDTLGSVHDMDVALGRIEAADVKCRKALVALLRKKRRRHQRDFKKAWDRLHQPKFQKRIMRKLGQMQKSKD